jgi:hypothetical protein
MKVKHQLKLLYFQVDKGLICMNIVLISDIVVKIYQVSMQKYFGKFEQPANLEHIFHPLFLYRNSSKFMLNLQ